MCESSKHRCTKTVVTWIAIVMVLSLAIADNVLAERPSSPARLIRSGSMTIEGKSDDAIISGERRFVVGESTTILDAYGKRIGLADLSVPVKAEVQYELKMDQDPLCLRIVIK